MSKPIHTPGPAQLPTGFQLVKPDEHEGMPLFSNGDPFDTIAIVLPRKECDANARLLAAAYNAFDSAAKELKVNAVDLAERMQDGEIAELIAAATDFLHDCDLGFHRTDQGLNSEESFRAALAKVKGDAP